MELLSIMPIKKQRLLKPIVIPEKKPRSPPPYNITTIRNLELSEFEKKYPITYHGCYTKKTINHIECQQFYLLFKQKRTNC